MTPKRKNNEKGFTLIELIMVIVILGIISAVAIPKFLSLSTSAKLSAARGIAGAVSSSISAAHADYLINNNTYYLDDVLSATVFTSGVAYGGVSTTPTEGQITADAADAAGDAIHMKYKNSDFVWTYTGRVNDTPGYITESSGF